MKADFAVKELFAHEKVRKQEYHSIYCLRDEGIAIGKAECILQLLKSIDTRGELSQELEQRIRFERDDTLLEKWHLSAARAETVSQFREKEDL